MLLNESEKQFVGEYNKRMFVLASMATVIFLVFLVTGYVGVLELVPKTASLNRTEDRVKFAARHCSIQAAWIFLMIYYVIIRRINTPALDPTNGYEHLVQSSKNVLNNSMEHGMLFIISQLVLAIDLEPEMCRRMIPILNLLYLMGRVFYFFGYPRYRAFGFTLFNFTVGAMVIANLYFAVKMYLSFI